MNSLKISVVTIVFNDVKNIEKTIHSVLYDQTYENVEYIIIDGGSTDGTVEIINRYCDRLSHFVSEVDAGISDAFNKGLKYCTGDIIGLINSGDYYEKDILAKVAETYAFYCDKSRFNVIHGNLRLFNQSRQYSKIYKPFKLDTFVYQMPIWHPTCFLSKMVYLKYQYNLDVKVAMDYDLLSKVYAEDCKFIYLDETVSHMNLDGISNSNAARGFREVELASIANLKINPIKARLFRIRRLATLAIINFKHKLW